MRVPLDYQSLLDSLSLFCLSHAYNRLVSLFCLSHAYNRLVFYDMAAAFFSAIARIL